MAYYLYWMLDRHDWIESIRSTTPFFNGNPLRGDKYPAEAEEPNEFLVEIEDPHEFTPKRVVEKGGKMYFHPRLHPKFKFLDTLREIGDIRDCVFFGDELGNLLPARNFKDQRQWLITKMAKDFRRHNVIFLATDQYNKSFDIQLRENFSNVVRPLLDKEKDSLSWEMYRCKDDPDFTNYKMKMGARIYPEENLEEYPMVRPSWLYRFFDSQHAVDIQFNKPLNEALILEQARDFTAYLFDRNPFGLATGYYKVDEAGKVATHRAPLNLIQKAVDDWNYRCEKYYYGPELNSILSQFMIDVQSKELKPVNGKKRPRVLYVCNSHPCEDKGCPCSEHYYTKSNLWNHAAAYHKGSILGMREIHVEDEDD